jgi:anti-sigma regulatory factor (Ser/Thr protein kinase)/Na+-translocating ferredoxin:NAD+ oxidoreductase RNF subunit RnfB
VVEFVSYDIEGNDFRQAGAASRSIKEHLKRIGADAEAIRRTMIAAYEAEMNVVIHSEGGRLEASLSDSQIDVNVIDGGPGIPDIEQAMTEGFSTASAEARALGFGAGMGLPNIKRNSDRLRVTSRVDEGTRVSFTIYLKPETTGKAPAISLYASADKCRDCGACLPACPTHAMRVWSGRPTVLEHLCIDCNECIAVCTSDALTVASDYSSLNDLTDRENMVLVVPPALLAGCGPEYPPAGVFAALRSLGFAEVVTVAPYEDALRQAALAAQATSRAAEAAGPLIIPSCPAVANLIELRFPSLVPSIAPYDSPWEAVQTVYRGRRGAYVVSCPSQRSALLQQWEAVPEDASPRVRPEFLLPETVHHAVMMQITKGGQGVPEAVAPAAAAAGSPGPAAPAVAATGVAAASDPSSATAVAPLMVSGMRNVIAVLEQIENGLLGDVAVVEPYACEGGCFGSPLLFESHQVATRRWQQGQDALKQAAGGEAALSARPADLRQRPFAARPGIRLDPDMSEAIQKLGRIQMIRRSFPGKDCGVCGAPTCAALAEDVVLKRAGVDLCPYRFEDTEVDA